MYTRLLEPEQILHTQSTVAKRGLIKRSYPYVKKLFNTQHGRIPIDPEILAAIGHRFIATKKRGKNWRLFLGHSCSQVLFHEYEHR